MSRDPSPVRKYELLGKPKFKPSITLEDQVVAWLGEAFRAPIVTGIYQVKWSMWEPQLTRFFRQMEITRTEPWPYAGIIAFFVSYYSTRLHPVELYILLERLFETGEQNIQPKTLKEELWPLIEKLKLEKLDFWNCLGEHLDTGRRFIQWRIRNRDDATIEISRELFPHLNNENCFGFSGPDSEFKTRFGPLSFRPIEGVYGKMAMDQMNSLIRHYLPNLIAYGKGWFAFPNARNNDFYEACKKELIDRADLRWNDDMQSVEIRE